MLNKMKKKFNQVKNSLFTLAVTSRGEVAAWGIIVGVVIGLAVAVVVIGLLTGGVENLTQRVISRLSAFIG